jgi:CBS domain-containing protein
MRGGVMRTVRDIMRSEVISVRPETSVQELVQLLDSEGISGVPVLDASNRVLGVVSRTDVIRHAARQPELPQSEAFWETLAAGDDDAEEVYFLSPESAVMVLPSHTMDSLALGDITVDEIMTPVAFGVDPEMLATELADFLVKGRIHRALVVDEDRLVGIVTAFDLLRAMAGEGRG